jgi:seryl-tRNA synthetase
MLDINYIREHADAVKDNCKNRGAHCDIDALLAKDEERRELIQKSEAIRAQQKQATNREEGAGLKEEFKKLEPQLQKTEAEYLRLMLQVPNRTHVEVPIGGENDFTVLATQGSAPTFDFTPKDHEELLTALDLLDFERGAKVAGAKFYFAKGDLVRLNRALISYGIDVATTHGFTLMETPDLAKNEILAGIGFNPRGPESQVYSVEGTDLSLIGTAEITVGGYHADEILDLSAGPKKYIALSHCFRTEAGTYGRESKGLYRVHQFTKLEMFVYCTPEQSDDLHQEMLAIEREIVDGLGLPYRVIDVAAGDLGAPAYRKFDIEAWMVMKNGYGEITSTSNCTDYQSRRLNIRYRTAEGKTEFVHTLNGTAVVTSRLPIAIAENFQNADGTIRVPDVLRPFMGGISVIGK